MANKKEAKPEQVIYDLSHILHRADNDGLYGPTWVARQDGMESAGMNAYKDSKDFAERVCSVIDDIVETYTGRYESVRVQISISLTEDSVIQKAEPVLRIFDV